MSKKHKKDYETSYDELAGELSFGQGHELKERILSLLRSTDNLMKAETKELRDYGTDYAKSIKTLVRDIDKKFYRVSKLELILTSAIIDKKIFLKL